MGAGRLSPADLTAWADALESRDDVAFAAGSDELLREFLFVFANPEANDPLDAETINRWKAHLRSSESPAEDHG
jgi:hypothetical protein